MSSELVIFAILFPALGLLLAIICQLAGSGRLKLNHLVGIRIPSLMSSDAAWAAGHRAVTKLAYFAFFAMAIVSVLAFVIGSPRAISAGAGVIITVFVVEVIVVLFVARRAARSETRSTPTELR